MVPLSGVLTVFYRGLLELSKTFLDPWGNEGPDHQNVNIDVLLAEISAGLPRWSSTVQSTAAAVPPDWQPS